MALTQEHTGRSYGPSAPVEISAQALSSFAHLLGFSAPEVAAGQSAAPTYAITQTFTGINSLVDDPDIRLDISRVVHSDQSFEYTRPLRPGDVVSTTTTIDSVKEIAGNTLVTLRSDIHAASGELLCSAHAALLVRGDLGGEQAT